MILFVYLVVVIVMMSKQKSEGKVVSGWTRFLVYSLLVLSILSISKRSGCFTLQPSFIRFSFDGSNTRNCLFRQIGDCIWFGFTITNPILGQPEKSAIYPAFSSTPALWLSHSIDVSHVLKAKLHLQDESGVDFLFLQGFETWDNCYCQNGRDDKLGN